ncbi:hypothetical protein [uncultured Stenotrophomonas sp.]|uniref:hypothetical protein n=1 Tax=uncultured Stenotrophomonas sp. TaxID=165438 RepID=UPI0025DD04DA|nr:hypothetical protein [uncultured Stenotrophomonas sp.]
MSAADALLQDLMSGDATRIHASASRVAVMFDRTELDALAPHADRIERACAGVTLGGALLANQVHLQAALQRLRFWQAQAGCLCALTPKYLFFDPRRLIAQGQMQLLSVGDADDGWGECHHVACTQCGQRWKATDREYHYPWWEWKAA